MRGTRLREPARAFRVGGSGPDDFAGDRYMQPQTLTKRLDRPDGPIAA